ncbi:uncharacterized protein ATNIH1004_004387 [Aspergillus tanneri]|uniref:Uncharacterized protein n=1 Tax=Aspergillus tanneri TaxID=1220188 RepID=A0A5M9MN95_9EURO|nr:uncharacterized protein ATNIH1004_004387 [Aspergillus tanneri]KAA8648502.1 hypothetical protein ATNIH1004_004387 [Aspergillus tanneri]
MASKICIGGPAVALGYLNRDVETSNRFITLDGLRCYRSGDYGRILSDGNLEYRGRISGNFSDQTSGNASRTGWYLQSYHPVLRGVVTDAAVIAKGDSNQCLVAFVVFSHALRSVDVDSFTRALINALPLPTYAKPATIIPVDPFPSLIVGESTSI